MDLGSLMGNIDPKAAQGILNSLDEEQLEEAIVAGVDNYIVPHLEDIRDAAETDYEDRQEVREKYESMTQKMQDEEFHSTVADLIVVVSQIRAEPVRGFRELKDRLRDPWVTEALLLIFDNDDFIDYVDPEYKNQLKEFCTIQLKWLAMNVAPEMYSEDEVRNVVMQLYPEREVDDVIAELAGDMGENT